MKKLTKLALLSTAFLLVGCNEKVSPELQDAASSSTVPPPIITPDAFYFSVTDASPFLLNYRLHKTGAGNATAPCEVRKNVPLSNSLYRDGNDPDSDITCFMEAEELSLYMAGMSLNVSSSANTCEYVEYSPFSYYNRQPGNSSTSLIKVNCSGDEVTDTDIATALGTEIETAGGDHAGCSQWVDASFDPADRLPFYAMNDEELCRFNYKDGDEEKCDIGEIAVREYTVSEIAGPPVSYKIEFLDRKVKCGGRAYNCVAGPIKLVDEKSTYYSHAFRTTQNQAFTHTYEYPAPEETRFPGNYGLANYRRNLASIDVDFGASHGLFPSYMSAFSGVRTYSPEVIDRYSNNRLVNGNIMIDANTYVLWSYPQSAGKYYYKSSPLAAEPFMGLDKYRVNPFYTFQCLDAAREIKARIRVIVRDWDRQFPSSSSFELISDIDQLANSYQDIPLGYELPGDQGVGNAFNDIDDWDDIFDMERTPGVYAPNFTIWRPKPNWYKDRSGNPVNYTDGFFNPDIFPNDWTDD